MTKQVIVIPGGMAFDTDKEYLDFLKNMEVSIEYLQKIGWKDTLEDKLGEGFDVVRLKMPNNLNSKYAEWEIYFKKYAELFDKSVILIGHSLGSIFLVKYLSENTFPKKIAKIYLISTPISDEGMHESLGDFKIADDLSKIDEQAKDILIYHSADDEVVPVSHSKRLKEKLKNSKLIMFKDKEHFNQEEFPEIVEDIKSLS